eukprot:c47247_g1_i1.p1 GENE.c47247_g1_i1~~c47247_g1_i1.p1  ORF type:complete len:362 (+),score=37.01 c47247_g1_i1:128-1087(+)
MDVSLKLFQLGLTTSQHSPDFPQLEAHLTSISIRMAVADSFSLSATPSPTRTTMPDPAALGSRKLCFMFWETNPMSAPDRYGVESATVVYRDICKFILLSNKLLEPDREFLTNLGVEVQGFDLQKILTDWNADPSYFCLTDDSCAASAKHKERVRQSHKSDILRLYYVVTYGGYYMDTDLIHFRKIDQCDWIITDYCVYDMKKIWKNRQAYPISGFFCLDTLRAELKTASMDLLKLTYDPNFWDLGPLAIWNFSCKPEPRVITRIPNNQTIDSYRNWHVTSAPPGSHLYSFHVGGWNKRHWAKMGRRSWLSQHKPGHLD